MSVVVDISSPSNPRVKAVARLRDRRERDAGGVFVVEGERDVGRAFDAGLNCLDLFAMPDADVDDATTVSREAMARMSYRQSPPPVLAVFATPDRTLDDLPPPRAGDLYVIAVGTQKPGNLGAMARTAAAAGCRGLVAAGADVDVWNPNAVRNSGGAVFALPCIAAGDEEARRWLADHAVTTLATVVEGAEPLWSLITPPDATAVVIGPEHEGLPSDWSNACDLSTTVPLAASPVDSLNASVTLGVVLFEMRRRTAAMSSP